MTFDAQPLDGGLEHSAAGAGVRAVTRRTAVATRHEMGIGGSGSVFDLSGVASAAQAFLISDDRNRGTVVCGWVTRGAGALLEQRMDRVSKEPRMIGSVRIVAGGTVSAGHGKSPVNSLQRRVGLVTGGADVGTAGLQQR